MDEEMMKMDKCTKSQIILGWKQDRETKDWQPNSEITEK
jgi:hypothetical protein